MAKATWNGRVLARSDRVVLVEGDKYFPPESINKEFFEESNTRTECPWRGTAHFYHIKVDGQVNVDAAWFYPNPKKGALQIKAHFAFWRGVIVE